MILPVGNEPPRRLGDEEPDDGGRGDDCGGRGLELLPVPESQGDQGGDGLPQGSGHRLAVRE